MDYDLMDEMSKTFQQGAEQLKQTRAEMQQIAGQLSEGALLGRGGAAFTEAIQNKLCPSIDRLSAKFTELQRDVARAKQDMMAADREARSKF
jgi:WXG100 family type VII secretion target